MSTSFHGHGWKLCLFECRSIVELPFEDGSFFFYYGCACPQYTKEKIAAALEIKVYSAIGKKDYLVCHILYFEEFPGGFT